MFNRTYYLPIQIHNLKMYNLKQLHIRNKNKWYDFQQ